MKNDGKIITDDRGHLIVHNSFNPQELRVKRFYIVSNRDSGFIRAWHGHRVEEKYVTVLNGTAQISLCPMESFCIESVSTHILTEYSPEMVHIPANFYNGWMSLTPGATLQYFSTSSLESSLGDDYREDWDTVNVWNRNHYR